MDINAMVHNGQAWAAAASFFLPFLGGLVGLNLGARWKGEQDHAQWLRGQRLEALTEFLHASDELGRIRNSAWATGAAVGQKFWDALARMDEAGTKIELLFSAETNMQATELHSLWRNEAGPRLVQGQYGDEGLAIDDRIRAAYLSLLRAGRKELGVKGDPYPESFVRKMHPHLSPPSEVRATHGGDRVTTDGPPPG